MTAPSETTDRVHAALDNFQPIGNATFRRVLLFLPWLMLAIAALNLLLWPVIAARFMWSTGMTAAALAVFAFIGLMQRIPQTFRALWNRNTIHACPPAPADEPPVAQYCAFVETTQRWMNDRRQFLFAALLSLIAVGWNVVAYSQIGGLAYLLRNATNCSTWGWRSSSVSSSAC